MQFGQTTTTYDAQGEVTSRNGNIVPTRQQLKAAVDKLQGSVDLPAPMFAAKRVDGLRLYQHALLGNHVTPPMVHSTVRLKLLHYAYPFAWFKVKCTKGTYVRSIVHALGKFCLSLNAVPIWCLGSGLGCGAMLTQLVRTGSGIFHIWEAQPIQHLFDFEGSVSPSQKSAQKPPILKGVQQSFQFWDTM